MNELTVDSLKDLRRRRNDFSNAKSQCLGKRDKSFAGRIDVRAVEICSLVNERCEYYTTSSCAGRCFLYQGHGVKSSHYLDGTQSNFTRCRISHDLIQDPSRYFNLETLQQDPTGGADPIRTIGQFEHAEHVRASMEDDSPSNDQEAMSSPHSPQDCPINGAQQLQDSSSDSNVIWLRYEPFILHISCRSLEAASALMASARPAFKNVGLSTWKNNVNYLVAIWGDEGVDMPLTTPSGRCLFTEQQDVEWLQKLVNERHERNWSKIDRFVQQVRTMPKEAVDDAGLATVPRSFDVIGDIAVLYTVPAENQKEAVGKAILAKNKAIKVCAVRSSTLAGSERAAGHMEIIAGIKRSPLVTSHIEFGIKCVVDLNHTFFSPRMGPERLRICQQVARGENVLVLFSGVGMEALQIAGRTEATKVVAIEMNDVAIHCSRNGHRMLERNKSVKCVGAADRLEIIEGDVLDILPTLERNSFDRILAPRPKEGAMDGDLGQGDGGFGFLRALLPVLKGDGGECHWYDFAADHEFPDCSRTKATIERACSEFNLAMNVIHVANAGSVAKRQLRICVDFRLSGKSLS